jgi:hypothetical protein
MYIRDYWIIGTCQRAGYLQAKDLCGSVGTICAIVLTAAVHILFVSLYRKWEKRVFSSDHHATEQEVFFQRWEGCLCIVRDGRMGHQGCKPNMASDADHPKVSFIDLVHLSLKTAHL